MTEIRTARLVLRHARTDDLEAMHAVLSNVEATRWWSTPSHASLDETRLWLDGMIAGGRAGAHDYVVEFEGRVVGKAGFWRLPDVGYILHPDVWGRGLAFEALEAVIDTVFAASDVETLTADVDPANARSIVCWSGSDSSGRALPNGPGRWARSGSTASITGSIGRGGEPAHDGLKSADV